jgi:hypothetical protein
VALGYKNKIRQVDKVTIIAVVLKQEFNVFIFILQL